MRKTLVVLLGVALAAPVLAVAQDAALSKEGAKIEEKVLKIAVGEKVEVKLKHKQPVRGSMGDALKDSFIVKDWVNGPKDEHRIRYDDVISVKKIRKGPVRTEVRQAGRSALRTAATSGVMLGILRLIFLL